MRIVPVKFIFIQFCLLITVASAGQTIAKKEKTDSLQAKTDTLKKSADTDSFLSEKVTYDAHDSMRVDMDKQKAYLYNNAHVKYEDIKLQAGYIEIDFGKNLVYATSIKDSLGKDSQLPVFEQAADKFTAGRITYNFKTKKGKINDVITQQNEGFIHGRDIKKDTNNVYYVAHGKYTTCDKEDPDYYIGAKKIKVIPDAKIITGPACLYIADIPTPLVIPFGYFPNKKGRRSGILIPSYGESTNLGFFLKDGGFYFGGSEKVDLALRADIYGNGSFGAKAASNYKNIYKYSGGLNISFSQISDGDKVLPTTSTRNDFFVRWSHSQDPRSHPSSRFSADVNAGSSSYNKYNGNVTGDYLQNTFSSNIAYAKSFTGTPFNFSANLRHNQNTQTKVINASVPELALTMNRIYPFKNKEAVGNKWYDKIGLSATANARNEVSAYDSTLFTNRTVQQMKNGVHFAVPISTSLNLLKIFTLTPSINLGSSVYFQSIRQNYDTTTTNLTHIKQDTVRGVSMANDYSVSAGLSTRLYGDYFFKTKHLKQIRHVATPTISTSYRPDFSEGQYGYYQHVAGDESHSLPQYSIYQYGIYGAPAKGRSGLIAFSLNNTLEAKTKKQSDSGAVFKKINLIDNLGVAFSYNAAVSNYNWSPINFTGRTQLFKKLDVTGSVILDPYKIDNTGNHIEQFEWSNSRLGRLTSSTLSLSTSLRSQVKTTDPKAAAVPPPPSDELDYINSHRNAYVDFNVPWNLNVFYNLNYSKPGLTKSITQSATFNGDLSVTKKWKISLTSGYDFTSKKLTLTSINIYRDLHCWEMRFNWVPFGFRQSYSVDISVKSAMLKDLKLSRRKDWYDYN